MPPTITTQGVKGRYLETRIADDHLLTNDTYEIETVEDGRLVKKTVPALQALNERLRQDYIEDCARGVVRWNKAIEKAGVNFEMKLPHRGFDRHIGAFAGQRVSPDGKLLSKPSGSRTKASGCRPPRIAPTSPR